MDVSDWQVLLAPHSVFTVQSWTSPAAHDGLQEDPVKRVLELKDAQQTEPAAQFI